MMRIHQRVIARALMPSAPTCRLMGTFRWDRMAAGAWKPMIVKFQAKAKHQMMAWIGGTALFSAIVSMGTTNTKAEADDASGYPPPELARLLSDKEMTQYKQDGYVIVEGLLNEAEVELLKAEMKGICLGKYGNLKGLEPKSGESGEEAMARYLAIHFPHKLSERMRYFVTQHEPTCAVLSQLMESQVSSRNVKCMQSMMFMKAPGKLGQPLHQDEAYIPTRDQSLMATWIALDDVSPENGTLRVIPGSHSKLIIWPLKQYMNDECAGAISYEHPYNEEEQAVAVTMPKGSVLFFHGHLLHGSTRNKSTGGFRRVLTNHYMSCESMLPWQGHQDYRDVDICKGSVDPYTWKPCEVNSEPYVRPSDASWAKNHR